MSNTSQLLHSMEQRSKEWFEARRGKFTASRFGALIAGKKTADTYIMDKVVETIYGITESPSTPAMRWGTEWESEAVNEYELLKCCRVRDTGFTTLNENTGGSTDGLIGADGILEVKCAYNPVNHLRMCMVKDAEQLLKYDKNYYWQCQGGMYVTNRKWCDFVAFDPRLDNALKIHIVRIERNEEDIKLLHACLKKAIDKKKYYLNLLNGE